MLLVLVFGIDPPTPAYPVLVRMAHTHLRCGLQRCQLQLKLCRKPAVIRVQKRHPARCRVLDTHISCRRNALILLGNNGDTRLVCGIVSGQPVSSAIAGSVVNNDDFFGGVALSKNRIERSGQCVLSVVRRDDDGNAVAGNIISRACAYFETSSAMIAMQSPALTRPPWRIA